MPEFEYYDFENWILCYYYPYMTLGCQGGAYITGVLYSFTNYRSIQNILFKELKTIEARKERRHQSKFLIHVPYVGGGTCGGQ